MKRHRWAPVDAGTAVRHHGRCDHCGLVRTRAPGSHATHYEWRDDSGKMLPVYAHGATPQCPPNPGEFR